MRLRLIPLAACFFAVACASFSARAENKEFKAESVLLWGTNESKSPDPTHKAVDEEIKKKLKDLPLKWTHYYEVNRKTFVVPVGSSKKETLSDKCVVEIRFVGKSRVEVSLYGKGEQVVKRTQDLPRGETLVLGGNAPNSTAWLVFVKRTE